MTKSYDNAKQNFLNSLKQPTQSNTNPIQQQQFQSTGYVQFSKSLGTNTLRPMTEGVKPSGGKNG